MVTLILLISLIAFAIIAPIGIISVDAHHDDYSSRGSSDPKIAVNGNDVFVVWLESNNSQYGDVYFTKITDGKTIEDPVNITTGTSFYPRPQIHVAENNIYLMWEDRKDGDGDDQIFFAKSNDGGKSFSEPRIIPENNESVYRPFEIHQVNDIVYLFGNNWNRDTQQVSIIYVTSDDFGDTFSEPITLFNHDQSDQGIQVKVYDDTIYVLSDDRKDFDEKGSIYLRKILPDGTLTDMVNVNGGKTTVTYPQFAVSGDDVYVSWRDRVFEKGNYGITERWYPVFTKSHDGGKSFDEPITLDSDPKSIDTVSTDGKDFIFAHDDSVYVLWKSEYYDGTTQSFKIYLAQSDNKGKDFTARQVPLNEKILQHGYMITGLDNDNNLHQIAITMKNPPFNDAAVYFSSMNSNGHTVPVDILGDVSTQIGWMPDFISNDNKFYFVSEGNNNQNCILYSYSDDGGKSFSNVVNISPNGNPKNCLGIEDEITSPKKQTSAGTRIEDVRCNEERSKGYILVLRQSDNQPLCVTSSSYDAMLERKIIDEKSFESLALSAAKNYLVMHPKTSSDVVDDSLDLEIYMTRHSIPPAFIIRGSFETTSPIYDGDNDPVNHSVEITLVQNNKIHLATIDDSYSLFDSEIQKEGHPRLNTIVSPTLKTILSPGDRINNKGLIPLIITEVSSGGYDKTTHWTFQSIGYQGDNKDQQWGFLPDQYRINETVDQDGNDAIDQERMPEHFGIPQPLFVFPLMCDGQERIEGESGWHYTLPTRVDTAEVHYRSTDKGIYPDENGLYDIRFVSMFKPELELLPNVETTINETILCPFEKTMNDATHAYYTHLQFKIVDKWTASYYSQESGIIQDGPHAHATILVKVFEDKFDFSQSQFHLNDPRINLEPVEPDMIHRNSEDATLGLLFETLEMQLDQECLVFPDGRNFCNNDENTLKFYVNDEKKDDISQYVISEDDRVLVSYGPESPQEIVTQQLAELESLAKYNYFLLENLMTMDVGTVRDGTYNEDLGFQTAEKLMRIEMKMHTEQAILENKENNVLYTSEDIFERIGEIEAENIKMYKFGPKVYEKYVSAKNVLEQAMQESHENKNETEKSFSKLSANINPETKSLDIALNNTLSDDKTELEQYKTLIEEILPDDVEWSISFFEDKTE